MGSSEKQPTLELFAKHKTVYIYVSPLENEAVHLAAEHLLRDIGAVTGCLAILATDPEQCSVVIGTLEQLGDAVHGKGLSLDKLKDENNALRWEAYLQEVRDGVLYILGTDRRGAIYGIYDLCEAMGVSPWYYWADVPVKTKDSYSVPANLSKADWPSVQYRGIFINDEEELEDWAKLHTPDGTIGPTAYRHVFELLLRLKANYIWPAMHVNYFNGNPQNGRLAEQMGIVVGTSHCDMLLRSNQNEWTPWITAKGYTDAVYDYSIEGRNREILQEYWRESVETNRNYEVSFTMGMRGIHDSGFVTKAIIEDTSLTEEQKVDAKVRLLGQVIRDQKQILAGVLGEKKADDALKTFIPYKEVLKLYDQGLELPEDMTLVWANDNFGHMRRYPNEAERSRKGGNGLYFHSSYWAHPGSAMSYLFINSTPLAHTGNELRKSYASGIRKLWVLNIGGLKPVEQVMEYFLRYGWEADKETGITKDAFAFTRRWIDTNFTGQHGAEAAELYESFAQITNVRKIEHMNSDVFSQTAYGDEAGRRLARLEEIFTRGNAILESLPEEERDAFFQLFLMKIHASYFTNLEFYYGDRSVLSYERGNMQAADEYTELSAKMTDCKRSMIHFYNKIMSGGKWDGIMTPENFPPPPTAMYPARKPALRIEGSGLRVAVWDEDKALLFSPYGRRQKWIELGNQGSGSIPFSITVERAGAEWITVSEAEGIVETEKRILVTVNDPANHSGKEAVITVHDQRNGAAVIIPVRVEEAAALPEGFSGYVESDGAVSIPAGEFARSSDASVPGWVTVPGLGRHEGAAVMAWLPDLYPLEGELAEQPRLEYDFFLGQEGSHMLEIHRNLTLNSTGRIRFGIGVDGHPPIMVDSETRDEWTGQWKDSVFNNGEKLAVQLPALSAGAHSLKLFMVDPYVTVSKLVLYTSARKATQLGPVPSSHTEAPAVEYGFERPALDLAGLERLCREFYRTRAGDIPLPDALYVSPAYNRIKDITFIPVEKVPQQKPGAARYAELWKAGGSKDMLREFGSGNFVESGGIVAIEAEYALANTAGAYLTDAADGSGLSWSHLQAETNGRTGLAMHVAPPGIHWENPEAAPGMHYRVRIGTPGQYRVWLHMRHYNNQSDSCYLALDGAARPLEEQPRKGNHHTYNTAYVYYWCFLSDLELSAGEHVLSILARKSQLRVDRIYLTLGDELPPVDAEWKDSTRV